MPESNRERRLAIGLPWIAGIVGALLFVRPLLAAPMTSILGRTFWYDAILNIDTLAALHESFSRGPNGAGFYDWLYSAPLFAPQPRPLVTSELIPIAALATWPFASHPVLAHNLSLFAACVLNVVAGAKLARVAGARPFSTTVAGIAFAFCAYTNFSSARVQLLFLFPMAWCLASLLQWSREGRTRDAVLTAVWFFIQAGLCLYYAIFLALTVPVLAVALRLSSRRPRAWRELLELGLSLMAAAIPLALLLLPYRDLKVHLGLSRPYSHVVEQSGSLEMLTWADSHTLFGGVLKDRLAWDSACFPGVVVCIAALVGLVIWARRSRSNAWPLLTGCVAALALAAMRQFPLSLLVLALLTVWLLVRTRRLGESSNAVLFATLVAIGVLLYFGPDPKSFDRSLGTSPYQWMYFHVPFIDGLRVARRAAILFQIVICVGAALTLSRLEARRWGRAAVGAFALFALVEGTPLSLDATPVPETCSDTLLLEAKRQHAAMIGEVFPKKTPHEILALNRHQATLCHVPTTMGNVLFTPPLVLAVEDALRSLPDPSAHAWLWDAGVRHLIVRRSEQQSALLRALEPIATEMMRTGTDVLLALAPPTLRSQVLDERLRGPVIPVRAVEFKGSKATTAAFDHDEQTNWQTGKPMSGHEELIIRFDAALVSGVEWHAWNVGTDLPRGLRIEREIGPNQWEPWAEWPSIAPLHLGREAVKASLAFPLEVKQASALRITQLGRTKEFWLSASELVVRGGPAPGSSAPVAGEPHPR